MGPVTGYFSTHVCPAILLHGVIWARARARREGRHSLHEGAREVLRLAEPKVK